MNKEQLQLILREELDDILDKIKKHSSDEIKKLPGFPNAQDVNSGWCRNFSSNVALRCNPDKNEIMDYTDPNLVLPVDLDLKGNVENGQIRYAHTVLYWHGNYYDAECFNGVITTLQLPFFNRNDNNFSRVDNVLKYHQSEWRGKDY